MTEPYRAPDEERQRALERERLAAEELAKRPGRLALTALALSVVAIIAPVLVALSLRSADSSAAGFVFFLGFGLGTSGIVLAAFVLFKFRRPGIGTVLGCLSAILVGLVAWPCALFFCFIAAGGAGAPGRPLRVAGIRILPRVRRGRRPSRYRTPPAGEPDPALVSEETRRRLARLWLADARAEHASVTAFERLAEDLVAAGAPEHLVEWARRAALDEVRHATMCFTVASAYAGRELRASRVSFVPPWAGRVESREKLILRLAEESLLDGGIEEGIAAKSARIGASRAVDPAIAAVLSRIAREEAGHAQLGYAIVRWAVREQPSVLPRLLAAVERSSRRGGRVRADQDGLLAAGRIGATPSEALTRGAHEEARGLLEKLSSDQDQAADRGAARAS